MEFGRNTTLTTSGLAGAGADKLMERRYRADPRIVPEARHEAMEFCRRAGVPESECTSLDLALGEALANAVRHGRLGPREGANDSVVLSLWSYRNSLIAYVHDCGPGFEPPLPPYEMPLPTEDHIGGRGLPLMELLSDAFMVCRGDVQEGGVSVFLVKRIGDDDVSHD